MAQSVVLPVGAPFGAEQITALNDVFSTSTAEQRAWLSGFLAGVQVANAPQAAAPAAPPKARAPLTILFGTESGNAEALSLDSGAVSICPASFRDSADISDEARRLCSRHTSPSASA